MKILTKSRNLVSNPKLFKSILCGIGVTTLLACSDSTPENGGDEPAEQYSADVVVPVPQEPPPTRTAALRDLPNSKLSAGQVWNGSLICGDDSDEMELFIQEVRAPEVSGPDSEDTYLVYATATISGGPKLITIPVSGRYKPRKETFSLRASNADDSEGAFFVSGRFRRHLLSFRTGGGKTIGCTSGRVQLLAPDSIRIVDRPKPPFGSYCEKLARRHGEESRERENCLAQLHWDEGRHQVTIDILKDLMSQELFVPMHYTAGNWLYSGPAKTRNAELGIRFIEGAAYKYDRDAGRFLGDLALAMPDNAQNAAKRHEYLSLGVRFGGAGPGGRDRKKHYESEQRWLEFQSTLFDWGLKKSVDLARTARKLRKSHPQAYFLLWEKRGFRRDLEEAAKAGHPPAHYELSLLNSSEGELEKAKHHFAQALGLGVKDTRDAGALIQQLEQTKAKEVELAAAKKREQEQRRADRERAEIARLEALNIPKMSRRELQGAIHRQLIQKVKGLKGGMGRATGLPANFVYKCDDEYCYAAGGIVEWRWEVASIEECSQSRPDSAHCSFRMRLHVRSTISDGHPGNALLDGVTDGAIVGSSGQLKYTDQWNFTHPISGI